MVVITGPGSASTDEQGSCPRQLPSAEQLAADVSALVTPPVVCVKLFELVRANGASAQQIGEVVALDPNLAGRLLSIVNSSYFGLATPVNSISRAVTVLGTRDLCNMALAIASVRSFSKMGSGLVPMEQFWQHNVYCALLARNLGKHYRVDDAERLFVAGLLHEVGSSVIHSQLPQLGQQMQAALLEGEAALHNAEMNLLGFSHASIGAMVLKEWQLSDEILDAVAHHHQPGVASAGQVDAALVHIADALANQLHVGALCPGPEATMQIDAAAWDILATEPNSLDTQPIIDDANDAFAECIANLVPRSKS